MYMMCIIFIGYQKMKKPKKKKKWLNVIGRTVGNFLRVCCDHFAEKDFNSVMSNVRRLKSNKTKKNEQ